jgi:Ca2+-binding RTX toxin-like protein
MAWKETHVMDARLESVADRPRASGVGDDEITDFSHAADTILLDHRILTKLNDSGHVKAGFFRLGTNAADGNDCLIDDKATGNLWYDRDGTGGQAKVLVAPLVHAAGTSPPTMS